jgi:hypothetical protein
LPPPELNCLLPPPLGPELWLGLDAGLKVWVLPPLLPPELWVEVPPELKLWLPLEKL